MILPCFSRRGYIIYALSWRARDDVSAGMQVDLLRSGQDGPTVGLLLCESHRSPIVEYTLRNIDKPIGVSSYRVTRELPAPIREEVPTVEDLQEVVTKLRGEMETLRRGRQDEE